MHILIATDAWHPQVNGVVRTYQRLSTEVEAFNCQLSFITPDHFKTIPFPLYPEVRLALPDQDRVVKLIDEFAPDFIHIATEGPVGRMVRRYCVKRGQKFTTSYHTKFPEYLNALAKVPESWTYQAMRRFHNAGCGVMVATPSLAHDLESRGFNNILPWTRGVDTELFKLRPDRLFGVSEPVFLYVGRVSKEKNIAAFLDLDLPGKKVVVGSGPHLEALIAAYPEVIFTGSKSGEELAQHYASADVFVFPSLTDTFGLVMLEAMASGVPVAAFPVTGPVDVVVEGTSGCLGDDLQDAALRALKLNRQAVRRYAEGFSWRYATERFLSNIEDVLASQPNLTSGGGVQVRTPLPRMFAQYGARAQATNLNQTTSELGGACD